VEIRALLYDRCMTLMPQTICPHAHIADLTRKNGKYDHSHCLDCGIRLGYERDTPVAPPIVAVITAYPDLQAKSPATRARRGHLAQFR
jgi:hypothetical protein